MPFCNVCSSTQCPAVFSTDAALRHLRSSACHVFEVIVQSEQAVPLSSPVARVARAFSEQTSYTTNANRSTRTVVNSEVAEDAGFDSIQNTRVFLRGNEGGRYRKRARRPISGS